MTTSWDQSGADPIGDMYELGDKFTVVVPPHLIEKIEEQRHILPSWLQDIEIISNPVVPPGKAIVINQTALSRAVELADQTIYSGYSAPWSEEWRRDLKESVDEIRRRVHRDDPGDGGSSPDLRVEREEEIDD